MTALPSVAPRELEISRRGLILAMIVATVIVIIAHGCHGRDVDDEPSVVPETDQFDVNQAELTPLRLEYRDE